MQVDFQFFINVIIGIFTFFGSWILKTIWEKTNTNANHIDELRDHHEDDLKETRQKINDLALSLPEKYVNKGDFTELQKVMHHRFDKLEEKLDALKK